MNRNKFVFDSAHTRILEIIKKNIDNKSLEKRQTLEKLLNKIALKIEASKLN